MTQSAQRDGTFIELVNGTPAYVSGGEAAPSGAVVLLQEAFGVNAYIRSVAAELSRAGFLVVAPSLYARQGIDTIDYADLDRAFSALNGLTDETVMEDCGAALEHLQQQGFTGPRVGVLGFCVGGRYAFLHALDRSLGAAVTFYGGGIVQPMFPGSSLPTLVDRAPGLATAWLGLFGDDDVSIPPHDVEVLHTAVADATVLARVTRFPGAGHGFHCPERSDYHPAAATEAWDQALGWLRAHLGSSEHAS